MLISRHAALGERAKQVIRAVGAEEITLVVDHDAVGLAVSSFKFLNHTRVYSRTDIISLKERTRLVTFQATPNLAIYIGSGIEVVGSTKVEDEMHLMLTPAPSMGPDEQARLQLFMRVRGATDTPTDEFIIYTL